MRTLVFMVAAFLLCGCPASAATPMPKYLRDLDRPYNAGDWTLQCNSSRFCQIMGVAKVPQDHAGVRAVVMLSRGDTPGAMLRMRFAFVDSIGAMAVPAPEEGWRLFARGLHKVPRPLRLGLGPADPQGAFPVEPETAARLVSALRQWPGSVINHRGRMAARMPRGDLDRLLRKMDRLQHPARPRLTAEEQAEWLKEYHYTIMRAFHTEAAVPDSVLLACDTGTYVNQPVGMQFGNVHRIWTAECPEGTKVFVQEDQDEPIKFDIRDTEGNIRPHGYAGLNADSALLEVQIPRKDDESCGLFLKFGHTGQNFAMIEHRRYDRCRNVPYQFWPLVWRPTSWQYADDPPK